MKNITTNDYLLLIITLGTILCVVGWGSNLLWLGYELLILHEVNPFTPLKVIAYYILYRILGESADAIENNANNGGGECSNTQ